MVVVRLEVGEIISVVAGNGGHGIGKGRKGMGLRQG